MFIQNIALVAGGNTLAKLITILSSPIVTRIYYPEEYGIFVLFTSVIGITGTLATLRYAVAIPVAKKESVANNILKLCFLVAFSLSLLWWVVIYFWGEFLAIQFSITQLKPYLWLIPITFLGKGFYEALNHWAIRHNYFRIITRTKISQSFSTTTFKIGLGTLGIRPLGLLVGVVAEEVAGIGSLLQKLIKENRSFFQSFSWKEVLFVAKRYKKFPLFLSWSHVVITLGTQLPILFITSFYGTEIVGVFGLAQSIINIPVNLLSQSISQVYFSEIAKYGKDNPIKIYNLSLSIVKKMFFVALFPVVIIIFFGPWMFGFVFGQEWYDAGIYARILSLTIFARFILSPIINILNVLEKQGVMLIFNIAQVLLVVTIFLVGNFLKLSINHIIGIYSILNTMYYLIMGILILRILKKQIIRP